jgi:beta-N-acetylhexosaminidase
MKKSLSILLALNSMLLAQVSDKEIANMFILGFYGTTANSNTKICNDLKKGLGGVIIFQKSPIKRGAAKNFSSYGSLKQLTSQIKKCGNKPLIAVDQEGGLVQRIKLTKKYPKASVVANKGAAYAQKIYTQMARELKDLGVNYNLAPVADLAINPRNVVINKWGRSYGKDWKRVAEFDKIFMDAMRNHNIATSLKHFPGHGSSLGDTHKGFVDVTNQWSEEELNPYKKLASKASSVMVAHIFNKNLDPKYPASLSRKVVTNLLRGNIGFRGVVISDDLQMGAIAKHYSLRNRIKLSIKAGVDIMLFANQVNPKRAISIDKLINITRELLNSGTISENSIRDANRRINRLKARLY